MGRPSPSWLRIVLGHGSSVVVGLTVDHRVVFLVIIARKSMRCGTTSAFPADVLRLRRRCCGSGAGSEEASEQESEEEYGAAGRLRFLNMSLFATANRLMLAS